MIRALYTFISSIFSNDFCLFLYLFPKEDMEYETFNQIKTIYKLFENKIKIIKKHDLFRV